jgi:hypothetical protein
MNLADLRAYVGNLLDYDPTNTTYDGQLDALLNDAQSRLLTDRASVKAPSLCPQTQQPHSMW